MKNYKLFALAAAFTLILSVSASAAEKNRTDLQTQVDATNLNEYNAQKMNDTLTDITDSAFLKTADTVDYFRVCGDATTVNNNTVYYGPSRTLTANTWDGTACDINAAGDTTEATADISFFNYPVYVSGMTCRNEGDANADITYTLRGGAADLTPSVTCTIADGERDCVADVQATNLRGANGSWAVAVSSTSNVQDNSGFVCNVKVRY
jgi:hypothetical protein